MVCGVAYVVPVGQAVGVGEVQARLIIEPPRWGLVAMVAWIGFLCLVMVLGAVDEHDPRGLFLVLVWLPCSCLSRCWLGFVFLPPATF